MKEFLTHVRIEEVVSILNGVLQYLKTMAILVWIVDNIEGNCKHIIFFGGRNILYLDTKFGMV